MPDEQQRFKDALLPTHTTHLEDEDLLALRKTLQALVSLLGPVLLAMLLTSAVVVSLSVPAAIASNLGFNKFITHTSSTASASQQAATALVNALILVGVVLG